MPQLDHPLTQQAQGPATASLGRFRAGKRNQVRFVFAVDDAASDARWRRPIERRLQPFLHQPLPNPFHSAYRNPQRVADVAVRLALAPLADIGLQ